MTAPVHAGGAPAPRAPLHRLPAALPLALVLAGALCYANSLRGHFVYDDENFVQADDIPPRSRPLYWATIALNRWISTTDPLGYHLVNVAIHLLAGLALLGLVRRTVALVPGAVEPARQAWFAFACALLWVVHPLQTGAVTYLSQRTESLSGMLALAALLAFVRSATSAGGRATRAWAAAALAAFALSVATKEIALVLPVLVLLLDRTFLAGSFRAALAERRGLHAAFGVATVLLGAVFLAPILFAPDSTAGFAVQSVTPLEYARSQPAVILHYLRLAVWPRGLVLDHMWPVAREPGEWLPQTLAIVALLAGTAWALVRRPWLGFVGAWFFVLLAPTSSVVPIQDLAFEHRMYLPLASVVVLVLAAAWSFAERAGRRGAWVRTAVPLGLAVALGLGTLERNRDYHSAARLWSTVVPRSPHWRAYLGLGSALLREGRATEALPALERSAELDPRPNTFLLLGQAAEHVGQLDRALAAYERADALRPGHAETRLHLGVVRLKRGDLARARADLEAALELGTSKPVTALHDLALVALRAGDLAAAERHFRAALELAPDDGELHLGLGQILFERGRHAEAAAQLARAIELVPDSEAAHAVLGAALHALGRHAEALAHHDRALALPPGAPPSPWEHHNRAETLAALGRDDEALAAYREAARIGPRFVPPRLRLAEQLLAREPRDAAAIRAALAAAEEADRLTGGRQPEVLAVLAEALAAAGEPARAIEALERALAAAPPGALADELGRRLGELR